MRKILVLLMTCSSLYTYSQNISLGPSAVTTSQIALKHYNEGMGHFQSSRNAKAKSSFHRALREDEKFPSAMDGLAEVYKLEEKVDSAIYFYSKSLNIFPRNLIAHQNLAALYILNNQESEAIAQYKSLLRNYQGYPEAYLGMARVFMGKEVYEEALKSAEFAMKIYLSGGRGENASEARWLAGKAYLALENPKMALKYFKACKKYYKEKPFYYYDIGLVYLQMNRPKDAQHYLAKAEEKGYQIPQHVQNKLDFMNSSSTE